ncbi:haloacid dehalogenase superfamily, subfamily IA, variant 3 with third motif having DD or ED [Actinacidiphila alni]|uniref:D,D-heptose 1,7-bisphosphate phosphatase n=1 Tax=Actinacidiphila alni TaxID=380248 RepID=A0A1I2JYN2_9ACTN|nr:HAD-IIIA family hydrolase [Actinacidiphila alni]SFF59158.1 haloacid dehalogenase superfamily, subfamily IA, variant 3 with third motif having DD or ED [Actinacidiphila alni]
MTGTARPVAVLFDRDGTLIHDVPYNADPDLVRPMPYAAEALRLLHAEGIATGVVSNQSGIGRGLLTADQVRRVNARVDALLGPFGTWEVCPHRPAAGCTCRKPEPGLVLRAAHRLGVRPRDCAVIGDIGADLLAARAAGAHGVIVPTLATRWDEYADEPDAAPDILTAVQSLLSIGPDQEQAGGGPS